MKTFTLRFGTVSILLALIVSVSAQMPGAIKISPEGVNGFEEVTLTFYPDSACFPAGREGLSGLDSIAMHSSAVLVNEEHLSWNHVIWFDQPGFNGQMPILYADSDTSYSITFVPADFYGTGDVPVKGISAVFNDGFGWEKQGKDFGVDGCRDFYIPLGLENASVTFHVNMSHQIFLGRFDPLFDFLDLAGNFNNWGNPGVEMTDTAGGVIDSIYSVTVDGLFVGQKIEYKFRRNKDWSTSEFPNWGENRQYIVQSGTNELTHWYDDAEPVLKILTLNVNMNYLLETGEFDPVEDSVDVAGTFNEWGFGDTIYWMSDEDDDGIYTVNIDSLFVGEPVAYKFRLDATWGRNEFPGLGGDRQYVIESDTNVLTHWWNDDDPSKLPSLFFSEYIDGPGNNNALVIANRKEDTIALTDYGLMYTTDGSDWTGPLPLDGTLSGKDFYLIVNAGFDFSLIDSASVVDSVWSEVTGFNGNDAIALVKIYDGGSRYRVLDKIGKALEDPVTGWDVAGVSGATQGKRLKRKSSILRGQADWTSAAGTNLFNSEWIVLDAEVPGQLGEYRREYTLANQWHVQNSGVENKLMDIAFDQNGMGIAVGMDGTALFSTSDGNAWTPLNLGTSEHLKDIHFPDRNHGWIVGSGGTILHTSNRLAWSSQGFGSSNYLESVYFLDSLNGFAAGEFVLLKTVDGGQNWEWLWSEELDWFHEIHFVNEDVGFAVGWNLVIMTRDGGLSWSRVPFDEDKHFINTYFFNNKVGWLIGWDGALLHTIDGGLTWFDQVIQSEGAIHDLHFVTPQTGWAAGDAGKIFKTTDGGSNWVEQNSGTDDHLYNIHFISQNKGWAVGDSGTIVSTLDGWNSQPSVSTVNHLSVFFVDESSGWIVGDEGTILKTADAGESWDTLTKIHHAPWEPHFDVFFADEDHGWLATSGGFIYKTEDGGQNWNGVHLGNVDWYNSVFFLDKDTGWTVAGGSKIARTTDGGDNWDVVTFGTGKTYSDVFFINDTTGWVVGQEGIVIKSTDGGETWTTQFTPNQHSHLHSVIFLDENTGMVVGSDGTFLRTVDGGTTWDQIPLEVPNHFQRIFFIDALTGWIAGSEGIVLHTIDGGVTWQELQQSTVENLNDIWFVDRNNGWAVGENGTILKTSSGGCRDVFVNLARKYRICDGEEAVFDAGSGFNYTWGTGSEGPATTATLAGYYHVVARNICQHEARDSIYLDVTELPEFEILTDRSPILCKGEKVGVTVELTNTAFLSEDEIAEYTFTWNRIEKDTASVEIDTSGYFTTTVFDRFGCNKKDSIEIEVQYPWDEKIGVVTYDPVERRNLVVWKPTSEKGTEYYNVYKVLAAQKKYLGSVNFNALTVYTDTTSRPRQQSDRYVITVVDTCGNESFYSSSHKTMHLTANKGAADEINLIWEHYEGLPVSWYYVYRGSDSTAMALLDSISYDPTKTQYTDENAPTDHKVYYQIGIKLPEVIQFAGGKKAGSGPYSHSLSNLEDNRLQVGRKDLTAETVSVFPNPFSDFTTIRFENPANKPYRLTLRDITGKLLQSQTVSNSEFRLLRGNLKEGIYFVELRGDRIYRGKVVIE